ncbi:MAG: beta-galactosidase, partial [Thermoguttaceae bacterium]|nr:beta-galactosidase [Thermoguttaceae bacterium]
MRPNSLVPAFLLLVLLGSAPKAPAEQIVKRFRETEEDFANPGRGWMTTRYLPDDKSTDRFPYSVAYFRLNWGDIEPAEGRFQWQRIDEPLRAWARRNVRIAFRIMTTNAHSRDYYCSPKWLFDAGCRSYEYVEGGSDPTSGGARITRIEPDYGDPLYLEKHGQFIKALAARYDGDPQIEFIDIGSYGIWGEWHTKHPQPWPVRKQIIDMYLAGFRKTQLVSMSDDAEALGYALAHGTGFRRDGVGSPWHEANWIGSKKYAAVRGFADHWKQAPVVFEWFGDYDYLMRSNGQPRRIR